MAKSQMRKARFLKISGVLRHSILGGTVPVAPSSLIAVPEAGRIEGEVRRDLERDGGLRTRFRSIGDTRQACKIRHKLEAILAVVAFGTAAVGGDSVAGIGDWAQEAPQEVATVHSLCAHALPDALLA